MLVSILHAVIRIAKKLWQYTNMGYTCMCTIFVNYYENTMTNTCEHMWVDLSETNHARNQRKIIILYVIQHRNRCRLIAIWRRGPVGQNVLNTHRPPTGLAVQLTVMTSSNRNIFRVTGHLCGEFAVPGEFPPPPPPQRPVTRSFDVFFDLRLDKRLSKQSWGRWFDTPSRPLWRHCNDILVHTFELN